MENEFGIWTLPATIGAVNHAARLRFEPAHYDAVERDCQRAGHTEITWQDVENVRISRDSQEAAICGTCGFFHAPPACEEREERAWEEAQMQESGADRCPPRE